MATPTETPETSNSLILAALIAHQITLLRLGAGITKQLHKLLDDTEEDLRKQIEKRLAKINGSALALTRLKAIEQVIKDIRGAAFKKVGEDLAKQMSQLVKAEPVIVASIIEDKLPVVVDMTIPNATTLATLVRVQPFEGRTLKEWAKKLERDDLERLTGQLRIGIVQGETTQQIVRRIVGGSSTNGTSGATELTRQHVESVSRTATNFYANQARKELFLANADIIDEELYVATLDARTTPVCRANDGKRFPLGEGPIPPLHFRCRSLRVAIIDGIVAGERPMKPVTEKMLLRRFTLENNLSPVKTRGALPRGYKQDFDAWSAKEVRAMVGRVPAATSYQEWLKAQSKEFQDDVLGKSKAVLFRKGGLTLDKFVDRQGTELTLAQLAKKYEAAFKKAGLDPKDFT